MAFVAPTCSTSQPADPAVRAVKVCGVARAKDAEFICNAAKRILPSHVELLIGMIMWPRSRRSVDHATASEIARVALEYGAKSVGVFVDEDANQIVTGCAAAGIEIAQLHGREARAAVRENPHALNDIQLIDVCEVGRDIEPPVHSNMLYTVCDSPGGGSGNAFDWDSFQPPRGAWLLAGGLTADNVAQAVLKLRPTGVDVSSGVTGADKVAKDPARVEQFLNNVVATTW